MSLHHLTPDEQAAINAEIEVSRISYERWRQIHRRTTPTLREEYADKYAALARDEALAEVEGE